MRTRPLLLPLLAIATVAGCHRRAPKPLTMAQALPNIPLPPDPQPLVRQEGVEAMALVVLSTDSPDSVESYYRRVLAADPFRLINERHSGNTTAFYAEQNGPSIWITVSPNGPSGSQVVIAGARDSTGAPVAGTKAKP